MIGKMVFATLLATASLSASAAYQTIQIDLIPKSQFYTVDRNGKDVWFYYDDSNMPSALKSLRYQTAVKMPITVPPGVSVAGMRAESYIWKGSVTGVAYQDSPYCPDPVLRPAAPNCNDSTVGASQDYVFTSDLDPNAQFGNLFPSPAERSAGMTMTTSEQKAYAWIVNRNISSTISVKTLTVMYRVDNMELYNAWVGGNNPQPPEPEPPVVVDPELKYLTATAGQSGVKLSTGTVYKPFGTFAATDSFDAKFTFTPPAEDVGKTVNLISLLAIDSFFFAVTPNGFEYWDPSLTLSTIPAYKTETLTANPTTIDIFHGVLGIPYFVTVYGGYYYRGTDGKYKYRLFASPFMLELE